jgi:hypothetical protein
MLAPRQRGRASEPARDRLSGQSRTGERDPNLPPELQHSLLWAKEGPRFPVSAQAQAAMAAAQATAGNAAVQEALAKPTPTKPPETPSQAKPGVQVGDKARAEESPTPEAIAPAAPPSEEAPAPAPTGPAPAVPPAQPLWAAEMPPPPSGGVATPDTVQAHARQVGQRMTRGGGGGRGGAAGAAEPQQVPAPKPAPAVGQPQLQKLSGRPPAPRTAPKPREIPDPIPEATKRIEDAANRVLTEQQMPPVVASPGNHMPNVIDTPLTQAQLRLIILGEPAMDRALLTKEERDKLPEAERKRLEEERDKLTKIRADILKPPEPAVPGAPAPAPIAPTPIRITSEPLPPSTVTPAQQVMFAQVLARLLVDTDQQGRDILEQIKREMKDFPDGVVQREFPDLGVPDLVTPLGAAVRQVAEPLAEQIGVAGEILDAAVSERREQIEEEKKRATAAVQQQADQAAAQAAETATAKQEQVSKVAQAAEAQAKERAKAARNPPKPTARDKVEASIRRIQDKVSEAIARYKLMLSDRKRALDTARDRQSAAYRAAAAADELVATTYLQENPSDPTRQRESRKRISDGQRWAREKVRELGKTVEELKKVAADETTRNIADVETAGGTAYTDLRAWAEKEGAAADAWWQETAARLDTWALNVHDQAKTWTTVEARLARLQLQRDLATAQEVAQAAQADKDKGAANYIEQADGERKAFINGWLVQGGGNLVAGLAFSMRRRVTEAQRATVEPEIVKLMLAAPNVGDNETGRKLDLVAKSKNPGFNAAKLSDTIWNAGENKIGTDEQAIFDALGNLTAIELRAVTLHYESHHSGHTLYGDLDSELSGDEWKRAKALLAGDQNVADVVALHDAMAGVGTDEDAIMQILQSLPEDRRQKVREMYEARYGEPLEDALKSEMSGNELDRALSLGQGKTAEAESYALDDAFRGGVMGLPDQDKVSAVYDRVREQTIAQAKREGWTAAELDAEITARNADIEASFNEKFANVPQYRYRGRDQGALRGAFNFGFTRAERDLNNALADNNMAAADAARLEIERRGVYASDDVMNGIIKSQYERSLLEVQLDQGPERRAGVERRIQAATDIRNQEIKDGKRKDRMTVREENDLRLKLEREMNNTMAEDAFAVARGKSAALDSVMSGTYGITLDRVITENMSGRDRRQARDMLALMRSTDAPADLRLRYAYHRVRYAIEGIGTDMPELRGGLEGLTKEEMDKVDAMWREDHPGETLREAVEGDTSGREEDDLVDMVDHGAATTVAEQMDELRRKAKRDRESVGPLGAEASKEEAMWTEIELKRMQALEADIDNPNLSPDRRAQVMGQFNQSLELVDAAIEAQRAAVDAFADMLTTVFQYVVGALAVVLGVVATVLTGGAALPALIAIAGSVIGTLGSMAIKAGVKGGAYGIEEIGTDLAVGAVDLIVTIATLGTVKGGSLIGTAMRELEQISVASIKVGLTTAGKRVAATAGKEIAESAASKTILQRAGGIARAFVKEQAHQFTTALPTALTANLLDERNWRHGNLLGNVAKGTLKAAGENVAMGMGMSVLGHGVRAGLGRVVTVVHPPATPVGERLAEFRRWQKQNPGRPHAEFLAHMDAQQAAASQKASETQNALREARRELLKNVPPRARAALADVPIIRVSEAEFRSLNRGRPGDAMIHVKDGQASLVIREGAPPSAAAAHAATLRETVTPGTAGRTVNPAEALPPHLRNRVPVEVNPNLAHDTVRVIPDYHPDGHIRGIKVEVGPNARAVDIQNHVGVIQTMRKYTGLLGRVRVALERVQIRLGMDVVSPLKPGQFEAALEMQKLPSIIEDRINRLSTEGMDPRARAAIEADILSLERQFTEANARFELGAAAEAKGYVAAEGRRRKPEPAPPKLDPKQEALRQNAVENLRELAKIEPSFQALEAEHRSLNEAVHHAEEAVVTKIEATLRDTRPANQLNDRPGLRAVLETLREGETSTGMDMLKEWMSRQSPDNGHVRALESLHEKHALAKDKLELREPDLLKELDPLAARRQELGTALAENPYYRERQTWFNQFDLKNLGDPGALICFPPETPVTTLGGPVPMGGLKPGDSVLSWDAAEEKVAASIVTRIVSGWTPSWVEITTDRGHTLRATRGHPFYETTQRRWTPARLLYPGVALLSSTNRVEAVVRADIIPTGGVTCNFTAEPHHSYFAGAASLLVHNGDVDDRPSNFESQIKRNGIIYAVMLKPDGPIIYVGKTYQTLEARWSGHVNNPQKQALGWGRDTYKIVELNSGSWTDFEIAVWEEHFIRLHGGLKSENPTSLLQNSVHAIEDTKFIEYRKPEYGHNPCL